MLSVVIGCGSQEPSVTPSQLPTLPTVVDTPFPTGALDPGVGWQRVDLTGVASPNLMSAVTVAAGRFLAVGVGGEADRQPIALDATDGLNWTSEPITSHYGGPSALQVVGDGVVAVGAGGTSRCAHPFAFDSWARAADGRWTEAPWSDAFCGGLNQSHVLAWRGEAWLVASGSGDQPFDWSSVDGRTWTPRGTVGGILPTAAVADGDDLLAFGTDEAGAVAARRSSDGIHWAIVSMAPVASQTVPAAFVRGGRLQAFLDTSGRIDVLTRDAAGTASIVQTKGMEGVGDGGTFVDLGDRLVRLAQDADSLPVGWSSTDGVAWTPIQLPADSGPGTSLNGIAVLDGVAVLVGQTVTPDGSASVGAIWAGSETLLAG